MSSFRKAAKARQRNHRERGQPDARAHLGLLEKKKEYKARAQDYHAKETKIKELKRKALERNPDEFYFKMVRTKLEDGMHQCESTVPKYTEAQLLLMQSQDLRYVNHKRNVETKKIQKMQSRLHVTGQKKKAPNSHIVFVDSVREAKEFDASKYFNTHPAMISRAHNRLTLDQLAELQASTSPNQRAEGVMATARQQSKSYRELSRRLVREKELHVLSQKMATKQNIMKEKSAKPRLVQAETKTEPAVYRWKFERKK